MSENISWKNKELFEQKPATQGHRYKGRNNRYKSPSEQLQVSVMRAASLVAEGYIGPQCLSNFMTLMKLLTPPSRSSSSFLY